GAEVADGEEIDVVLARHLVLAAEVAVEQGVAAELLVEQDEALADGLVELLHGADLDVGRGRAAEEPAGARRVLGRAARRHAAAGAVRRAEAPGRYEGLVRAGDVIERGALHAGEPAHRGEGERLEQERQVAGRARVERVLAG